MVMWVCEAWQVNIWTVFAVRPNGPKNKKKKNKNNFASSRSDHLGSDKHLLTRPLDFKWQMSWDFGTWVLFNYLIRMLRTIY